MSASIRGSSKRLFCYVIIPGMLLLFFLLQFRLLLKVPAVLQSSKDEPTAPVISSASDILANRIVPTRKNAKENSDRFCALCIIDNDEQVTCKETLDTWVKRYNKTYEQELSNLVAKFEQCVFTDDVMEFKLDDMCFITANIGRTQDAVDKVPSVKEFSSKHGSKFFYFSNLETGNTQNDGWRRVVVSAQEMKHYNRWTTHSRLPKFLGWKHPEILSAACNLIVYCDAYLCNPNIDYPNRWLERGRMVLDSNGGLMQLSQPGQGGKGPEYEVAVGVRSGKLDAYLGEKTIDWLRSQHDYNSRKQPTVYKCAIMIYDPNNKKIQRVTERFWSVYSEENLGWRDQPFWSYFLSSENITPLIFNTRDLFVCDRCLEHRGFGDHTYTINDIAMDDAKILQTAMTFDIPWIEWMRNNRLNQQSGQELLTILSDKLLVKEWLATKKSNLLSKMKIPKTYFNTTNVDTITLKNLPSSYVLKSNHASGTVIPVKNGLNLITKQPINEKRFKREAKRWMGIIWGEWGELWYANIKPQIFAEEFIATDDSSDGVPIDYKLHVIHQQVVLIQVCLSRFTNTEVQFYNRNFERLDMAWTKRGYNYYNASSPSSSKPAFLDDMVYIAEQSYDRIPYMRVDLFESNGELYFSEFTFAHLAGVKETTPRYIGHILGYMLAHKESIPMLRNFTNLTHIPSLN